MILSWVMIIELEILQSFVDGSAPVCMPRYLRLKVCTQNTISLANEFRAKLTRSKVKNGHHNKWIASNWDRVFPHSIQQPTSRNISMKYALNRFKSSRVESSWVGDYIFMVVAVAVAVVVAVAAATYRFAFWWLPNELPNQKLLACSSASSNRTLRDVAQRTWPTILVDLKVKMHSWWRFGGNCWMWAKYVDCKELIKK